MTRPPATGLHRWLARRSVRVALALATCPVAAVAATLDGLVPPAPDQLFLQLGMAEAARSQSLGAAWRSGWRADWLGGQASLQWEASFGQWKGQRREGDPGGSDRVWATQLGLTPVLRWQPGGPDSRWLLEGGIGANLVLPGYRRQDKRFSTSFNFGDHLAVAWRLGDRREHEVALRIQHYSNGGIQLPNPGENFRQLRYTRHF